MHVRAGLEYELLLTEYLTALDIPFYTEADLRVQGYFKTPDVWLQVAGLRAWLGTGRGWHGSSGTSWAELKWPVT